MVTGYARSGKDTLADGMMVENDSALGTYKVPFSESLKTAADLFLNTLGVYSKTNSFHNEEFKVAHRKFLILGGTIARHINPEVFAAFVGREIEACSETQKDKRQIFVIPDWRYVNEYFFIKAFVENMNKMPDQHWFLKTAIITKANNIPACETEATSIGRNIREVNFDYDLLFQENQAKEIKSRGEQYRLVIERQMMKWERERGSTKS